MSVFQYSKRLVAVVYLLLYPWFRKCTYGHRYFSALNVILQRPIVEFSLEDSRKLKIKEMRQQKNKVRVYSLIVIVLNCYCFFMLYCKWKSNPCACFFPQNFSQNKPLKDGENAQPQTPGAGKGPKKGETKPQSSLQPAREDRGMNVIIFHLVFSSWFPIVRIYKAVRHKYLHIVCIIGLLT